ncbi:GDA1/CD39 (nucleoside phosphatase) family protein [Besnoitia besnoiti]|uniref:GDA1/CD39 (Nucleoside phosphatase) family protein n=1 Tax=Besnoitia besnoiti TaxID=94643 RepID=A0A2A9M511_BESBE|nr:GDA1/CD39 (nucleoside phosphatase) family protein [Besnoitia besnoiti]PFH31391.1 GDA1/CD39 (nucleoside phosphatase) family protein [Besnoitia besnoiti]
MGPQAVSASSTAPGFLDCRRLLTSSFAFVSLAFLVCLLASRRGQDAVAFILPRAEPKSNAVAAWEDSASRGGGLSALKRLRSGHSNRDGDFFSALEISPRGEAAREEETPLEDAPFLSGAPPTFASPPAGLAKVATSEPSETASDSSSSESTSTSAPAPSASTPIPVAAAPAPSGTSFASPPWPLDSVVQPLPLSFASVVGEHQAKEPPLASKQEHPSVAHGFVSGVQEGQKALEELMLSEVSCRQLKQALIVVDGGSSKTLPSLFTVSTESCPHEGRRVLEGTLKFIGEGTRVAGVRDLLEDWLTEHAGQGWESRELDSATLMRSFPSMQRQTNELVANLVRDIVKLLNKSLSEEEQAEVKAVGVPIFFHTTAGVRGFPDWYRDGMFVALRRAINASPPIEGYTFFTNSEWTKPISGEVEGIYAFLTANLLSRNFERLMATPRGGHEEAQLHAHRKLAGIVEVGGASMQIVFPVRPFVPPPPFAKVSNLQREGYLPHSYPPVDLVAVSFMQLGASSASGIFLKMLCGKPEYLKDGICHNPCLFKGFEHSCSAGEVSISAQGEVSVSNDVRKNRLKPAATFCGAGNSEIMYKMSSRLECMAAHIDPLLSLEQRLEIPGCDKIVGTGDFATCAKEVDDILIDPNLPLPANQEAVSLGFETPAQIFKFMSSSAPLFVTGASLVMPVKLLQSIGLLPEDFDGTARNQLFDAAARLCATPVAREADGALVLHVPQQTAAKPVKLNTFTYETCHRLAMAVSVLKHIDSGARRPHSVRFEMQVRDGVDAKGRALGNFGWQVGTILHHVTSHRAWSRAAYELGVGHTFHDRRLGATPHEGDVRQQERSEAHGRQQQVDRGFPAPATPAKTVPLEPKGHAEAEEET